MKSESTRLLFQSSSPIADAFQAFFEMVHEPAALCDAQLSVMAANAAFEVLVGTGALVGRTLAEVLVNPLVRLPEPQQTAQLEVQFANGRRAVLSVTRRGSCYAVVAKSAAALHESLEETGHALLLRAQTEKKLLELGRAVTSAANEEALVAVVASGMRNLFAGCAFCVRISEPRTAHLTSVYAEGSLKSELREQFFLRHSMVAITHLDVANLSTARVHVTHEEVPLLFHSTVRGLSTPLVANGQFFGALTLEYLAGSTGDLVADERTLIQVANQVAMAVRNVKLIDELTFMRRYLEDLIENANALILVVNTDLKALVVNKALAALTSEEQLQPGGDASVIFGEAEWPKMAEVFQQTLSGVPQHHFETLVNGPHGELKRVVFSTSLVLRQSGEVEGVMAIGQDVTRVRALETQVVQAEKLASLGQLAATVAHEINNPMTAVSTYADALLSRALTDAKQEASDIEKFRRIVENSERVLRFTRNLMSYARPASETFHPVSMKEVLERAVGFCEHVFAKYGVTLEKRLLDTLPVMGVAQNLTQVFVNLLTNACHASAPGASVVLELYSEGDSVIACVTDTGAGITPEVRRHLFEPFFTTKTDGKGTGLGLSIVAQIVERHRGVLSVESVLGRGSVFSLKLPAIVSA